MIKIRMPFDIADNFWRMFENSYTNVLSGYTVGALMQVKKIKDSIGMPCEIELEEKALGPIYWDITSVRWTMSEHEAYAPVLEFFREIASPHMEF